MIVKDCKMVVSTFVKSCLYCVKKVNPNSDIYLYCYILGTLKTSSRKMEGCKKVASNLKYIILIHRNICTMRLLEITVFNSKIANTPTDNIYFNRNTFVKNYIKNKIFLDK